MVTEWPAPETDVLPHQSSGNSPRRKHTVSLWDTTQLGHIPRPRTTRSITLFPDDPFIAVGGNVTVKRLSHISVSSVPRWPGIMLYLFRSFFCIASQAFESRIHLNSTNLTGRRCGCGMAPSLMPQYKMLLLQASLSCTSADLHQLHQNWAIRPSH